MTCKDCYHYDVCHRRINSIDFLPVIKGKVSISSIMYKKCDDVEKYCLHFRDKSRIIELPFIAMIEQYLVNGKFADNIYLQKFNGRYATVYIDKNKWGTPLIDICGKNSYNTEEVEKRIKELNGNE